jgi:two-component sensor histidine kinase
MTLECFASQAAVPPLPLYLVEEINHRVITEYAEAISLLALASAGSASQSVKETLSRAADRLRAHSDTHCALLPPPNDGVVNLADYIGRLCASLSKALLAAKSVRLAVETDEVWLPAHRCWRIGLIVAELVRNASRHGLSGGPGSIAVRIAERSGQVSCVVCDDGRGAENPNPGRGMQLVRSLATELGGSVEWWFTPAGCLACLQVSTADEAAPG